VVPNTYSGIMDFSSSPVRKVTGGTVVGTAVDGVQRFLSVPYAAPPVGESRFSEARPVENWDGERDATRAGSTSWYKSPVFPGLDIEPLIGPGGTGGDDYLTVNVWAPEGATARPVMVWIHGGAFALGSKDASVSDGTAFAKSGIVCVAINYRLGIDGFLPIPGAPTNLGLRDMIAALKWVRENVGAFGGDPDNLTVFGESAGAMAIADLVTSPLAKGLFKRAIIQSGHGAMVREIGTMQRLVRKLAKLLKITPDLNGFRSVDFATGWAAMEKVGKPFVRLDLRDAEGHEPVFGISRFTPVFGDDVLPKKPLEALKDGAGADVDVLIGTNAEEMNFYFVPTKVRQKIPGLLAKWLLKKSHPTPRQTLKAYGYGGKGKPVGHAYSDAMTDLVFRWPARRFAEEHRGRTHVYEFDWRSPRYEGEFGATHGMELPFVFRTLPTVTGPEGLAGENPPQELADKIHQIWVDFATDGAVPWQEFDRQHRNVHLLSSDKTIDEPPMPVAPYLP
jgi:para-nitrobenzyl esterase